MTAVRGRNGLTGHGRKGVRMGEMGPVACAGDLDEPGRGGVGDQPVDRLAVVGERVASPPVGGGDGERGHVERGLGHPDGVHLGSERGTVGPAVRLRGVGQPLPRRVPDHAAEEPFRPLRGVPGLFGPSAVGPPSGCPGSLRPAGEPGERGLVGGDRQDRAGPPGSQRRIEGDDPAVAVPDHHGGPVVDDGEQVVDVPSEGRVDREQVPRAVVPAPVIGQRVEVAEAAEHAGEASRPVERAVHQHQHRGGRRRVVGDVLGDREGAGRVHPGHSVAAGPSPGHSGPLGCEPPPARDRWIPSGDPDRVGRPAAGGALPDGMHTWVPGIVHC